MKKTGLFLCLLLLSGLNLAYSQTTWKQSEFDGKTAPVFELKDNSGKTVALSSFAGKVIILNFWATRCPPCLEEMPSLNALYNAYKDKGLVVIAISTDRNNDEVTKAVQASGLEFLVLYDNNHEAKSKYNVFALPTSFIINKDGLIADIIIGGRNWMDETSKAMIEKFISN
jgi:peroxiredoxin